MRFSVLMFGPLAIAVMPALGQSGDQAVVESNDTIASADGSPNLFRLDVAAILNDHCVACHGAKKTEGGYRLDSYQHLMQAGDSDEPPVVAGDPDVSVLVKRISEADASQRMPPDDDPLSAEEIDRIRLWIKAGARPGDSEPQRLLSSLIPPEIYPPPPNSYPPIPLTALAFSPEQEQVICGGYHELTIWDIGSQSLVRRIGNLGEKIFSIAVHPNGQLLAVACGEPGRRGEVRLIDYSTGEVLDVVARASDTIWDVAFRPGREEIAVASSDLTVKLIQFRTKELLKSYASHADWVVALAFSADGNRLVSASRDRTAKVFDLEAGQMLISYPGHARPVRGVCFSPDGTHVLSVGDDKKLHLWNISDGKRTAETSLEGVGFRIGQQSNFVFVPSASGKVYKIDANNNNLLHSFGGQCDWVLSTAIANDGRVVSGCQDGYVSIWAPDGTVIARWQAAPSQP